MRFNEVSIRAGVKGVLNVMALLGMRSVGKKRRPQATLIANTTRWVRAPQSGTLRAVVAIAAKVEIDDVLAFVNDPLGENNCEIPSTMNDIIIGKTNLPLVFEGEAIFNIATYEALDLVSGHIDAHQERLSPSENEDDDDPALV